MTAHPSTLTLAVGVDFTASGASSAHDAAVAFNVRTSFEARRTITSAATVQRLVVCDLNGTLYAEMPDALLTEMSWALNEVDEFSFTLPANSPHLNTLAGTAFREVQVWLGDWLACWGPVVRIDVDADRVTCQGRGAPWYLKRRYIGDTTRTNLITNPSFDSGKAGWSFLVQDTQGGFNTYAAADSDCYWEVKSASVGSAYLGMNYARLVDLSGNIDDDADYREPFIFQDIQVTAGPFGTWFHLIAWCWISGGEYVEPNQRDWGVVLARMPTTYTRYLGLYTQHLDHDSSRIDADTPRSEWVRQAASIFVPANETEILHCRLTGVHGVTWWDAVALYADDGLEYPATEQATIISNLVTHAQSTSYGKDSVNLSCPALSTGYTRDRRYPFAEHQQVWQAIHELTEIDYGVDLRTDYTPTARPSTPQRAPAGKHRANLALTADSRGGNIVSWRWQYDGDSAASQVTVLANGRDADREEAVATDGTAFSGVLLEEVVTAPPPTDRPALSQLATERLAVAKAPDVLTVIVAASGVLGVLRVGDTVPVRIEQGGLTISGTFRVVRLQWRDDERVVLDLNRRTL